MTAATIAATCRELISAGKDNQQIFKTLQKKFGVSDDKRHYPQWYRREMERQAEEAKASPRRSRRSRN